METFTFDPIQYKQKTRGQWQNAAEGWHRWMPVIHAWLEPATELMLDLARIRPGSRVLDVAAGEGDQSLAAAQLVGPHGHVLVTDLTPGMLAFAESSFREAALNNVETRVMDGERLELNDAVFDAVICRLGLMFFPHVHQGLSEMRRVLKPGGRASVVVFTTLERNPLFAIPFSVIRKAVQLSPPAPGQPGLFNLGERGVLEAAFSRAGFREVETHILSSPMRLSSAAECIHLDQDAFPMLGQMLASLRASERKEIWSEIEQELGQFESLAGFSSPAEVIVGVGVKA